MSQGAASIVDAAVLVDELCLSAWLMQQTDVLVLTEGSAAGMGHNYIGHSYTGHVYICQG